MTVLIVRLQHSDYLAASSGCISEASSQESYQRLLNRIDFGRGGRVRSEVAVAGDQLFTFTLTNYVLSMAQFSTLEDDNRC